ncbi:MAG: radical SAM protein [Syntrophotalea acetylenica]|jgi:heme b synthase|uniref:Radical SAM/SPASM domain-containing protein n=1 Tax=Syntrophotalea acetylenica TaxID=29542 RepID=A0A1L3GDU5_SYNAC|nr:radical SAM protein [Syntrophotalea acetylenica]APG24132.1 radical SAM/SPASM domain-containing protein [Syntrophotalea acetylenica]APG44714.1 radical SAM/SPASM domain-containing protein [Syntrophotalea acetylenica]MDD4458044.1 radical SAM protein [Syntrophotalea acetylenica]
MPVSDLVTEFLPKWIAWETTRRCNLQCIHCRCSSDSHASEGNFSTREAFALIDDICTVSRPVMVLSGGEPLLRKDIFEIADYGTAQGLRMCMATNGTLITDSVCRDMLATGIRMVSLSLDGSSAAVHDDFRRCPGAFDAVVQAAGILRRNGIPFLVNSSFTKRNQSDIAATFQLAKKLGAQAWYLFMIVPTGRGESIMEELISGPDYEEILAWHYRQERDEKDILMRPTCAPHYYRIAPQLAQAEGRSLERRSLSFSTGGGKGCLAGQSICFIDAFGEVKPCSYFPRSAGNIKNTPFRRLWFDAPILRQLRDFSLYRGKCGNCEYLRVCGGCRARADAVYGDYLAEEPFCSYQPGARNIPKDQVDGRKS